VSITKQRQRLSKKHIELTLTVPFFFFTFFQAYVLPLQVSVRLGLGLGLSLSLSFTFILFLPSLLYSRRYCYVTGGVWISSNFKIHRHIYSHCLSLNKWTTYCMVYCNKVQWSVLVTIRRDQLCTPVLLKLLVLQPHFKNVFFYAALLMDCKWTHYMKVAIQY